MMLRELRASYKLRRLKGHTLPLEQVSSPAAVASLILSLPNPLAPGLLVDAPCENFGVLLLNTKHVPISYQVLHVGTLDCVMSHPRDIFRAAVLGNAAALVLFHNHPSGETSPSRDDKALTDRVLGAGVLMGIPILDHIIIGPGARYFSFREGGLL